MGFNGRVWMTERSLYRVSPIYFLIVIAVAFGVYANDLVNAFVIDDRHLILKNPWITDFRFITTIISTSVWSFQDVDAVSNHYRPLYLLYYMASYYIFGFKAWGFHLVNNLFHVASSLFVFLISVRLFTDHMGERAREHGGALRIAALFGALIFATHPVNTESVVWIAAVSEVSFAFFCFASLYLYISSKGFGSARYWLSVIFFLLGAFSKETSVFLPMLLVAYDLIVKRERVSPFLPWVKRYAPFVGAGVLYLLARIASLGGITPMRNAPDLEAPSIALNFLPLVGTYIYKLLLPVKLIFFEYLRVAESIGDWRIVASALFIIGLVVLGVWFSRTNRLSLFALFWIVIPMIPVFHISFLKGHPALAERYLYVPTAGFGLLAGAVYLWLAGKRESLGRIAAALLIIIIILYSVGTVERNRIWRTEIGIWQDTVKKAPDNKYAHNNLGIEHARAANLDEAIGEFRLSLEIDPSHAPARNNLGVALARSGRMSEAAAEFRKALESDPTNPDAGENLRKTLMELQGE